MFKKKNKILFKATIESHIDIFDPPVPSKKMIPDWYKKQDKYIDGKLNLGDNGNPNHTVKSCMPVFDMITAGYIIKTPVDIFVENIDGHVNTSWSSNHISAIESHPITQYDQFKIPSGYNQVALKFIQPWVIETPPGYSCILMQPFFHDNLPFLVIPAIVDTDKHPIKINFPFFIRDDFSGIIPMGTPMAQVIPFKREGWSHEVVEDLSNSGINKWFAAERKIGNRYKTFFREKKDWN
jgi:hypothetical protein